jgi:hypothetical protein
MDEYRTHPPAKGGVLDDPEAFRAVLERLNATGDWDTGEGRGLLVEARDRFAALARKHRLSPEDAMSVAFEVMCQPSLRRGVDPVAVLVHAVATTLRAWEFADERLCSIDVARRGGLDRVQVTRFSDRDQTVWDHHPAFTVSVEYHPQTPPTPGPGGSGLSVGEQADQIAGLFAAHGWDRAVTARTVEAVLLSLAGAGSRASAYETLRRNHQLRTSMDLPKPAWTGLLRLLLGTPSTDLAHTRLGQGILLRLALGETTGSLAADDAVTGAIAVLAPTRGGGTVV